MATDLILVRFHSETQILTTLFGLLFWDIIFAQVPGAFETPFQFGPLDIGEDSFYYARRERMEERLREILDGQAPTIVAANDERYREDKTCCIGVSWDVCGREDLLEIVEVCRIRLLSIFDVNHGVDTILFRFLVLRRGRTGGDLSPVLRGLPWAVQRWA
jgi:Fanconi-associated nuclease 1